MEGLGANYHGTQWYQRAYDLIGKHGEAVPVPASAPATAPKLDDVPKPKPVDDQTN